MMRSILGLILFGYLSTYAGSSAHPHHAALFLGAAASTDHLDEPHLSVGLDYEYIMGKWGVGAVVEALFADHTAIIAGPALFVHPMASTNLFVVPGIESADGHSEFLIRAGAGYSFHVGSIGLGPVVYIDYVNGHSILGGGLTAGMGF